MIKMYLAQVLVISKIGFVGLIEQEWIETLSTIDFDDLIYENFVDCASRLAQKLRQEDVDLLVFLIQRNLRPSSIQVYFSCCCIAKES